MSKYSFEFNLKIVLKYLNGKSDGYKGKSKLIIELRQAYPQILLKT